MPVSVEFRSHALHGKFLDLALTTGADLLARNKFHVDTCRGTSVCISQVQQPALSKPRTMYYYLRSSVTSMMLSLQIIRLWHSEFRIQI